MFVGSKGLMGREREMVELNGLMVFLLVLV